MLLKTFKLLNYLVLMIAFAFMTLSVPAKAPPGKQFSVHSDAKNVPSTSALFDSCVNPINSDVGRFAVRKASRNKFKTQKHRSDPAPINKIFGQPPELVKRE